MNNGQASEDGRFSKSEATNWNGLAKNGLMTDYLISSNQAPTGDLIPLGLLSTEHSFDGREGCGQPRGGRPVNQPNRWMNACGTRYSARIINGNVFADLVPQNNGVGCR